MRRSLSWGLEVKSYIIHRLLATIPVVFIVVTFVFFLVRFAPGDPALLLLGSNESNDLAVQDIEAIRHHLGLDQPMYRQYATFLWQTARGDLGTSVFSGQSVTSLYIQRLGPTLSLGILALILAVGLAIPMGVLAAWRASGIIDRGVMIYVALGFSVPAYWLAYNLIFIFSVRLGWLPAIGYSEIQNGIISWISHLILPAFVAGITTAALTTRITRSSMLEVLREDYIRTARAKGLSERVVLFRHALRSASIPILTTIGFGLVTIVTGIVVIEVVFAIPGMGRGLVEAIQRRDYPIIQGLIIITAGLFILINLVTDILYAYLDPRIRY